MSSKTGSTGSEVDYEKILFEYQSKNATLEKDVEALELEIEKLKKENAQLKRQIVDRGKKTETKKHGLEKFGASFE